MVLFLVGAAVMIVSVWVLASAYENFTINMSFVGLAVGAVLFFSGIVVAIQDSEAYAEETEKICTEKGGVVTKDNLCIVDNKPVEFEPGVWQR